ncbi:hypothetical protein HN460_02145 [bacterium]|jgi:uncharacterized membrane protein required for colicin V production|nr:hypothetical protein [bacterium]MBT3794965.1 hypothetical protein [bacterium]MBT4634919.1 hypothetical protein [bacterium]
MLIYDFIFGIVVLIFGLAGFYLGIIKSFSKFFCLLIPLFVSFIGSNEINSKLISDYNFYSGHGSYLISTICVYLALYGISKLFFFLINMVLSYLNLSLLNRVIGLLTGLALGSVIGFLLLLAIREIFNIESLFCKKIIGYLSFFLTI